MASMKKTFQVKWFSVRASGAVSVWLVATLLGAGLTHLASSPASAASLDPAVDSADATQEPVARVSNGSARGVPVCAPHPCDRA